jgi:hypothetical protein
MSAKRKIHPEDLAQAEAVNKALYFTAYFRAGPHNVHRVDNLASFPLARDHADALAAQHNTNGQGKLGLVYAVCPGNFSVLCTAEVMALVGDQS